MKGPNSDFKSDSWHSPRQHGETRAKSCRGGDDLQGERVEGAIKGHPRVYHKNGLELAQKLIGVRICNNDYFSSASETFE